MLFLMELITQQLIIIEVMKKNMNILFVSFLLLQTFYAIELGQPSEISQSYRDIYSEIIESVVIDK